MCCKYSASPHCNNIIFSQYIHNIKLLLYFYNSSRLQNDDIITKWYRCGIDKLYE